MVVLRQGLAGEELVLRIKSLVEAGCFPRGKLLDIVGLGLVRRGG